MYKTQKIGKCEIVTSGKFNDDGLPYAFVDIDGKREQVVNSIANLVIKPPIGCVTRPTCGNISCVKEEHLGFIKIKKD